MIVLLIFIFGITWTVAIIFQVIRHFYGSKIGAWWIQYKKTIEADALDKKLQEERKLKQLEASVPIEVEVEDMGRVVDWDLVKYRRNSKEEIISYELEIVNND